MKSNVTEHGTAEDVERLEDGLAAFNEANSDVGDWHKKAFVIRNEEAMIAGLVCNVHWCWLHVDILFVEEAYHGQGLGSQLLAAAETYAKSLNCVGAYLDTLSFQAPDFYLKHGYEVLARLDGFPPGEHQKYYFYKRF